MFEMSAIPPITIGDGCLDQLGDKAAALAPSGTVVLVLDPWIAESGLGQRAEGLLARAGLTSCVFDALRGEPKTDDIRAATALARTADLVVGIGGGSALDTAKIAAACAPDPADPLEFAGGARALPPRALPKILVPTTAGTGAESSSTAIFSGPDGRKLWIWGAETKAEVILLDPELTASLPPALTAACAMDAFVHGFEASTNRRTHAGAQLYGHEAMRLITAALPRAVADPGDLAARRNLLLGACYAGVAIDASGTAVAHMISHALAGLAPVSHGLATALAFEATLPWLVEARTPALEAAAVALGLTNAAELPAHVSGLMDRAQMSRRLPEAAGRLSSSDLATAMRAPENAPMREATVRAVHAAETERFAEMMVTLAEPEALASS